MTKIQHVELSDTHRQAAKSYSYKVGFVHLQELVERVQLLELQVAEQSRAHDATVDVLNDAAQRAEVSRLTARVAELERERTIHDKQK